MRGPFILMMVRKLWIMNFSMLILLGVMGTAGAKECQNIADPRTFLLGDRPTPEGLQGMVRAGVAGFQAEKVAETGQKENPT